MVRLTYRRTEWATVSQEVMESYRDTAPSGLVARIDAVLREMPAQWADERCTLELDPASADVVQRVVARLRGEPAVSGGTTPSASTVREAEGIVADHQRNLETPTYRVEHRTDGAATVIAYTSDAHARQEELSHHAARLMAAGASGELVLVEEATGLEAARRLLWPEQSAPPDTMPS